MAGHQEGGRANGPVWGRRVDGGGRGGDRWTSVQYRADRRPADTLQVIVVRKASGVDRVVLQGAVEVDKVLQVGSGEDFWVGEE